MRLCVWDSLNLFLFIQIHAKHSHMNVNLCNLCMSVLPMHERLFWRGKLLWTIDNLPSFHFPSFPRYVNLLLICWILWQPGMYYGVWMCAMWWLWFLFPSRIYQVRSYSIATLAPSYCPLNLNCSNVQMFKCHVPFIDNLKHAHSIIEAFSVSWVLQRQ